MFWMFFGEEFKMTFETLSSEITYQGRAFTVRRDQVQAPDGQILKLDIVQHIGAVTILPVDEIGQVWFVRQYRHATGKNLLELPAGTLTPGELPEDCAAREIREETGMGARTMVKLGSFFLAPGYSTEYMHVFLASDLYPDPLPGDEDEFLSVEKIPLEHVRDLVGSGEILDSKTLSALYLWNLR